MQLWLTQLIDAVEIKGGAYCTVAAWPHPPVQISIRTKESLRGVWIIKFVGGQAEVFINPKAVRTVYSLQDIMRSLEALARIERTTLEEVSKRQQGVFLLENPAHENDSHR